MCEQKLRNTLVCIEMFQFSSCRNSSSIHCYFAHATRD